MRTINVMLQAQRAGPNAPVLAFRKQDGPRPTYVLDLPQGGLPPQILAMFQPTFTLGKDQLVFRRRHRCRRSSDRRVDHWPGTALAGYRCVCPHGAAPSGELGAPERQ